MPEIDLDDAVQGADPDAIHDNIANEISAISEKTAVVSDDIVLIEDSEASFVKKKVKKSNFATGNVQGDDTGSTADAAARFNGITGTKIKNSKFIIPDHTYLFQFDWSAFSKARTVSVPNASDTMVLLALAQVLQSKGLHHSNCYWWDGTRKLSFTLSGFTADRVITVPNATDTMCLLNATQTLAAKTLTTPTIADFTNATHDHGSTSKGGALAEKYKRRVIPIQVEVPLDNQEHLVLGAPSTYTVKEVTYHTSSGTVNINFQHRDKTAMFTTSTTKLWSSDQLASTTNVTATTFSGTSEIAADDVLVLTFDSPSSIGTICIWLEIEVKD